MANARSRVQRSVSCCRLNWKTVSTPRFAGARGPSRIPDGGTPVAGDPRYATVREILRPVVRIVPRLPRNCATTSTKRPRSCRTTKTVKSSPRSGSSACCSGRCSRCSPGAEGSRRVRCAGRDLQREAEPRGVPAGRTTVSRLAVTQYISHGLSKTRRGQARQGRRAARAIGRRRAVAAARSRSTPEPQPLAQEGDRSADRPHLEVDRTIEILCRRRKNNPLYVGEAGVGKTAIVEGLARMIVEGKVPDVLVDCTIYALDMGTPGCRHQVPR